MNSRILFKLFLIVTLYHFDVTYCDEVLVQINVNRPVNVVSDKYVSFSIDPKIINESVGGNNSQVIDHMASQLSPAYLKISGESFFKLTSVLSNNIEIEDEIKDNKPEELLRNFNDWISSVGWKPVIPLPYSPLHWDSMEALRILNISSALGIKDCVWQLGIDFNATGATNYVADLITLQTMVGAFHDYVDDWRIVGADISAGSSAEETKLYVDLVKHIVESVGWMPSNGPMTFDSTVVDKDLALKNILNSKLPSWLSLPSKVEKYKNIDGCSVFCVTEGLQWAQTLGEGAKSGFKIVYKPLGINDFNEPNLNYYISLLFKRNMGEKVFDAKIIGGDKFVSRIYSHCSKERAGGLALMAVNMGETRSKILTKFSAKSTGSEVWQYIVSVNNGIIMLNDEQIHINSTLDPFIKIKHPSRPVSLSLPAMSVGFWVLPHANHDECLISENTNAADSSLEELTNARKNPRIRTSSDKLLQQLIMKNAATKSTLKRQRRHIVIKKDSNYLKQQLAATADDLLHSDSNLKESTRYRRFILKSGKPKGLMGLEGVLDVQELFDINSLTNDKKLHKRNNFPAVQLIKLDTLKNTGKRIKRQAMEMNTPPFRRPGLRGRFPFGKNMKNMQKAIAATATAAGIQNQKEPTTTETQIPEDKILEKKDNINMHNIPNGDVHFKLTNVDGDYDYVEFDDNQNESDKKKTKIQDAPDDQSFQNVPTAFHESYKIQKVIPREKAYSNGEIWEAVSKPDIQRLDAEIKNFPDDQHVAFVTKELEPTYNQNNAGLRQAQQQLRTYYMQTLNSNEYPSAPKQASHHYHQNLHNQQQQQTKSYHPMDFTDDEYFFNSRESSYLRNHNSPMSMPMPMPMPMPTPLQAPKTVTTMNNNRFSNVRWKRSICEKCAFSIDKTSAKSDNCICSKTDDKKHYISKNHLRKRRNALLKSISWALSNEVNVIPKETSNNEAYRRYLPYRIIPRDYSISMRPHNYNDVQQWRSNNNNNENLYNLENSNKFDGRTSNTEKRHIDDSKLDNAIIIENVSADSEKPPKFMQMFSEKVSSFMDMINHHVTGWWNTWA